MDSLSAFEVYQKSHKLKKNKKNKKDKLPQSLKNDNNSLNHAGNSLQPNEHSRETSILKKKKKKKANPEQLKVQNGELLTGKRPRDDDQESNFWNSFIKQNAKKKRKKTNSNMFNEFTPQNESFKDFQNVFLTSKKKPNKLKIDLHNIKNDYPLTSTPLNETNKSENSEKIKKPAKQAKSDDVVKSLPPTKSAEVISLSSSVKSDEMKNSHKPGKSDQRKKPSTVDSIEYGRKMLQWIISPMSLDQFFGEYWEQKPLYIPRKDTKYFEGICSKNDIDLALKCFPLYYGKHVDITAYRKGKRTTENPSGRARPSVVWDFFRKGHSVRLLNPQSFIPNVGKLVTSLQEYFRCCIGVNSYLTPAGTQGFAPHYDDIEAFVMQLEGEKIWRVYPPRNEEETLPRFSSSNFTDNEIGNAMLEVTLKPGDLLYFPRGFIHQARSVPDQHSLHITLSAYQTNTWFDYLEKAIPVALQIACQESVLFRKGLPLPFFDHLGLVHSEKTTNERKDYLDTGKELLHKLVEFMPWDAAADQMAKNMIHDFMPAILDFNLDNGEENWRDSIKNPKVKIKLLTKHCIRLIAEEEDRLIVYYTTDNSREYHGEDAMAFEIDVESAPALELLISEYPYYTRIGNLPNFEDESSGVGDLLSSLAERHLIMFRHPNSHKKTRDI